MSLKIDLVLVGGGRIAAALMALVSIRVMTTFLTPEQFGVLSLLISVQMFCGLFLLNPFNQYINLHTHGWWDEGTLIARLRPYKYYVAAVSIVGVAGALLVSRGEPTDRLLLTAAAVFLMVGAGTWNTNLVWMLNMVGFRAESVILSLVTVAAGLGCSVVFVRWSPTAPAWFAGQAVGMLVGAVGAQHTLSKHAHVASGAVGMGSLFSRQTILKYCVPLALATGLMWLQLSGYRFVVNAYWGLAELGFLAIGLQLAGQVWSLGESLAMQFLYPLFYRRMGTDASDANVELAFSDLINTLVPVYLILGGSLMLCAPYLLKLLAGERFHGAVNFVVMGAAIECFRVLANLLSNAAHAKRKMSALTMPYAVGAAACLSLIYVVGVRHLPIMWACAGLAIGGLMLLATMWICMRQQIHFTVDFQRWFFAAAVMAAMGFVGLNAPQAVGVGGALGVLVLTAVLAAAATYGLLRKNLAISRLLNVQLRKQQI